MGCCRQIVQAIYEINYVYLSPRACCDFRQDKQNEVLVTNSSLNEKQMELEQIRGAVKREEHKSEQEGERVMGVCRESGQVMLAINNLHSRLESGRKLYTNAGQSLNMA